MASRVRGTKGSHFGKGLSAVVIVDITTKPLDTESRLRLLGKSVLQPPGGWRNGGEGSGLATIAMALSPGMAEAAPTIDIQYVYYTVGVVAFIFLVTLRVHLWF